MYVCICTCKPLQAVPKSARDEEWVVLVIYLQKKHFSPNVHREKSSLARTWKWGVKKSSFVRCRTEHADAPHNTVSAVEVSADADAERAVAAEIWDMLQSTGRKTGWRMSFIAYFSPHFLCSEDFAKRWTKIWSTVWWRPMHRTGRWLHV